MSIMDTSLWRRRNRLESRSRAVGGNPLIPLAPEAMHRPLSTAIEAESIVLVTGSIILATRFEHVGDNAWSAGVTSHIDKPILGTQCA